MPNLLQGMNEKDRIERLNFKYDEANFKSDFVRDQYGDIIGVSLTKIYKD